MVNDPWLGRLIYDIDEFDEIWFSGRDKVREYFYYEILGGDKSVFPSEEQSPWEGDEEIENYDDEEDYMEDEPEMWSQEWIENILEMARQATGNETLSMSDLADFDEETGHQDWSSGEALLNAFVEWFGGDVLGLHGDLPGVGATRVGFAGGFFGSLLACLRGHSCLGLLTPRLS